MSKAQATLDAMRKDRTKTGAGLDSLFRANSIVLVGAKDGSLWSDTAFENFGKIGFGGKLYVVNRRGTSAHGLRAATSCAAIGEPVDTALLMVPVDAIPDTLTDLEEAGIRSTVVLGSGFAETGPEGVVRQNRLAEAARAAQIRVLGPNCIGFINFVDRVPAWLNVPRLPVLNGSLAVVSQSGAMGTFASYLAHQQGIGLSYVVSTGNEADINVAEVIDYLVDQPGVKAIAMFLETVRDTGLLRAAALKAATAEKPVIVLKVGTSEITAKAAQAHTGALVGDDRVFGAACQQSGIIRVQSMEDLINTAHLITHTGPISRRKLGFVSISGGLCEIGADLAEKAGVPLATFSEKTVQTLQSLLPDYGTAANPLDLTGAAMLKPSLFADTLKAVGQDPEVGLIALANLEIGAREDDLEPFHIERLHQIRVGFDAVDVPGIVVTPGPAPVTSVGRKVIEQTGIPYLGAGIHRGIAAIERAFWWSARLEEIRRRPKRSSRPVDAVASPERLASERAVLAYLAEHGVPVVPAIPVTSPEAAAAAARKLGGEVVLKVDSPDIPHKSDVGGVVLGIPSPEKAALSFSAMLERVARAKPQARLSGAIVSPMRREGEELFVGMLRDPDWGPAITLGFGGIWVEMLQDTAWRLLPVTQEDVLQMLTELRATKLLDGYRGRPPANRHAIADAVVAIGNAALALGPKLVSLEVNPLLATAETAEALDALAVWDSE